MIRTISGFAVRRPVLVIVLWVAVLGAGFGIGTGVFERLVGEVGAAPGSESDRAAERLAQVAPRPETVSALFSGRPADDPALRASLDTAIAEVRAVPGVAAVAEPVEAQTGQALLVEVTLTPGDGEEAAAEAVAARLHAVDAPAVAVAGGPLSDAEFGEQAQSDVAQAELLSTPVVLVLLLVIFGGLLAAGLPLLVAVVGVAGTFGVLYLFSTVSEVSVYAIQVTTMLAVGLAVDYALLMVSRFREERRATPDDLTGAIARTTATAGRTVLFSGLTVAAALAGLVVFPDPFLRSMGLAGAAVVAVDMVAALTLLPALLRLFGRRIRPSRRARTGGAFARIARGVQRRPVLTLVATAGAMLALAGPVLDLQLSQGDPRMLPASTQTRQLWDGMADHFGYACEPNQDCGPGQADRPADLAVLAEAPAASPELAELRASVAAVPGIRAVVVEPLGPELAVLYATPEAPADDPATQRAVAEIRALPAPVPVTVAGDAAELVDYQAMLAGRLPWAVGLVALGTLLLLFGFTGSLLLPIKAVLTSLLSIGAALGVVVWVFQQGHLAWLVGAEGLGYLHLTVPVLVGAIAFGLSVDYEVFLLSRIRERWRAGVGARVAVADGLQRTGGIVTAAGLVIGVVFAGFIAGGFAPIKAIGLGLVLAIALDATVVRMLLVPATMTLLGRWSWWPNVRPTISEHPATSEPPATEPADRRPVLIR